MLPFPAVTRFLLRLVTAIRLTRLTMAVGAVSNLWFIILLTRSQPQYHALPTHSMSLWISLPAAAVVAIGLFSSAAAWNDILDARHDSAFAPQRPIPAGDIAPHQAMFVAFFALIAAVFASLAFGTFWAPLITLIVAAMILFYNTVGRYIPAMGIVTIGLIHGASMFIVNHQLTFTVPVWLVMTHTMAIALLVYQWEDKRPTLSRRGLLGISAGWLFWSGIVLGYGYDEGRLWPEIMPMWGLIWPALAIAGFVVVAHLKCKKPMAATDAAADSASDHHPTKDRSPSASELARDDSNVYSGGRGAAEKLKRYGSLWQSLYDVSWLIALGLITAAFWIGLFAMAGFVVMTILRELSGLSGRPIGYRA